MVFECRQPDDMERPGYSGMDEDGRSISPQKTYNDLQLIPEFETACVALFFAFDAAKLYPSYAYPSEVLLCLQNCRALAAQLPTFENGFTQDQEEYLAHFLGGLLTLDELAGLLRLTVQDTRHLISPRVFEHALKEAERLADLPRELAAWQVCTCGTPLDMNDAEQASSLFCSYECYKQHDPWY